MRNVALLLLICLAACNGNKRLDNLPYTPDRIDGSYQGRAWLTNWPGRDPARWWKAPKVDASICPPTDYGVLLISDHTLYYAYAPNLTFNAPVMADGTLTQTIGAATLSGKVSHSRLTFDVVTPVCSSHFAGGFIWNHS